MMANRERPVRRGGPADRDCHRESPWRPVAGPVGGVSTPVTIVHMVGHVRYPESCQLTLADGSSLLVSSAIALDRGLKPGITLDAPSWHEVLTREAAHRACQDGIRLLALRSRTMRDLELSLGRRRHPPEAIVAALSSLQERGWLDDAAFARHLVARCVETGGWGARRIALELARRGVPARMAADVMAELLSDDAPQMAIAVARQRVARLAGLPAPVAGRRLAAFLGRRGFTGDVVWYAVRTVLGHTADPE